MATEIDALALAQALIRRPSVTPKDAGALDVLEAVLKTLGFTTHRLPFGDVDNLYARLGTEAPHFCFAGHTDVVPVGEGWKADPFAADDALEQEPPVGGVQPPERLHRREGVGDKPAEDGDGGVRRGQRGELGGRREVGHRALGNRRGCRGK